MSQYHYGSIHTIHLYLYVYIMRVSIPLWFDSYGGNTGNSPDFRPRLNTTMVRFILSKISKRSWAQRESQYHYGSIHTIIWNKFKTY